MRVLVPTVWLLVVACDHGTADLAGKLPHATAVPGSHLLAAPNLVAITYDGDPNRGDLETFYRQYAASPAWAVQTAEYGVGALHLGAPQHLADPVVTDGADLAALFATNLADASAPWGAADDSTIYTLFIPDGSPYSDDNGTCCVTYHGFHDETTVAGVTFPYALVCECHNPPAGVTPLEHTTTTASHELIEATTDPRPASAPAFLEVDDAHRVWGYPGGAGELGDLCEFAATRFWLDPPDMAYAVQRTWSNAAADDGRDPCVGDPARTYDQAVPDQPAAVTVGMNLDGSPITTVGTKIAVGATGTIHATIAGSADAGPFIISAADVATIYLGATTPLLRFVQPSRLYHPGDPVEITTTVAASDPGLAGNAEAFVLSTMPSAGGPTTYYFGLVSQ